MISDNTESGGYFSFGKILDRTETPLSIYSKPSPPVSFLHNNKKVCTDTVQIKYFLKQSTTPIEQYLIVDWAFSICSPPVSIGLSPLLSLCSRWVTKLHRVIATLGYLRRRRERGNYYEGSMERNTEGDHNTFQQWFESKFVAAVYIKETVSFWKVTPHPVWPEMAICRQVGDFETLLATKTPVDDWRFFWRFLAKMTAIFGDFNIFQQKFKISLHKLNILKLLELIFGLLLFVFWLLFTFSFSPRFFLSNLRK